MTAHTELPFALLTLCIAASSCASHDAASKSEHEASSGAAQPAAERATARAEDSARAASTAPQPFSQPIPGSTASLDFVPVPGGSIEVVDPASGAKTKVEVEPFLAATSETTWDMYDAFVFAMDRANDSEKDATDAWTRPSKPYILMDRGFGKANRPVISVSVKGAAEFCKWLSAKTGRTFRLPTEAEWELAARAGSKDAFTFGAEAEKLGEHAWFQGNSNEGSRPMTHPVKGKSPNALGLYDVHGNAAEWTIALDGSGVARGGSYKENAAKVGFEARRPDSPALNATDPQIPKSVWWLADGGYIGFRVVCEAR